MSPSSSIISYHIITHPITYHIAYYMSHNTYHIYHIISYHILHHIISQHTTYHVAHHITQIIYCIISHNTNHITHHITLHHIVYCITSLALLYSFLLRYIGTLREWLSLRVTVSFLLAEVCFLTFLPMTLLFQYEEIHKSLCLGSSKANVEEPQETLEGQSLRLGVHHCNAGWEARQLRAEPLA
jgi:hypothetical protein